MHQEHGSRSLPRLSQILYLVLLTLGLTSASPLHYTPSEHGIILSVGKMQVELAVQGLSAFRVSVSLLSNISGPIDSPLLETQHSYAPFAVVNTGGEVGIKTAFGQHTIDPSSAHYTLQDASGATITAGPLFSLTDTKVRSRFAK